MVWALKFLAFLLGPDGQKIMGKNGFGVVTPGIANDMNKIPSELKSLVKQWP